MSKLNLMMIIVCLFISSPTRAQVPQDIFILAGQSNMAGRGGVVNGVWDGFIPTICQPKPNILSLSGQEYWVPAHEPLHKDIDISKTCGVGPGMAFANSVQSLSGSEFGVMGLVPCAIGGTKISHWARGTALYNQMVARANAALREGGKIQAVLWYQGESDTVILEDAKAYKGRLERLIADLRSDLQHPSLLFIQVALASGEGKYVEIVRQAQLGINLPNAKIVDAKGLQLGVDHLHLTTISQAHLGIMLAHSFWTLFISMGNSSLV